ncbi:MAG TPA: PEP-CTERM sorting domain-containing protein [Methylophilaceae bacterium]|nr:PEP-CTERM sorting domain-containing protein [Methylophilaceae bacterium]
MFSFISKAALALTLLAPSLVMADIIHWEVRNVDDPELTSPMGRDFVLTGGFDYNSVTGEIFNITLRSSTTDGCISCNDYADGGVGETFLEPSGQGGVLFKEEYGPEQGTLGRRHSLQITGGNSFDDIWAFDVSQPGTYLNLDLHHTGFILLDDPLDPDIAESVGCDDCAYAIGTLVPVPEPESYAMMLAGMAVLGWQVKRKGTKSLVGPAH